MPTTTQHATGMACWPELSTTDQPAAKKFYGELFGWQPHENEMGQGETYTMLKLRNQDVAGLYSMQKEQRAQGILPNWMTYIAVESADQTVAKSKQLGGTVVMEPMDVFDYGRMAVIKDPTGAVFSVWQPKTHAGAGIVNEPGSLVWTELYTNDPETAKRFYSGLFSYSTEAMSGGSAQNPIPYTVFMKGDSRASGMLKTPKEMGNVPSHWLTYFAVENCDTTVAKTQQLGGKVLMPPTDIPNIGRFSILQDPQGAAFAVITITMPPQN